VIFRLWFNLPINGITLLLIGFVSKDAPETTPDHEFIHVLQCLECGIIFFLPIYLYDYLDGRFNGMSHKEAYLNIRFERDAFKWQGQSTVRPGWAWLAS
jgi:hypothetical protein